MEKIAESQKIEIEFWRDSPLESPESNSVENLINKFSDAGILLDCLKRHSGNLVSTGRVLELGGGQGWGSCLYKRLYPEADITATDISEHAVKSLHKWERLYDVKINHSYACTSYEIQEADGTLDLIFCFAAAHHFLAHKRTLQEFKRVLKPGGRAIYFYEPTTPKIFYRLAHQRVNRKRPHVPEDVLITANLRQISEANGFTFQVDYHPSTIKRGPIAMIYYLILGRLPFIQRLLPCTANLVFTKQKSA